MVTPERDERYYVDCEHCGRASYAREEIAVMEARALEAAADDMERVGSEEFDTVNYPVQEAVDWLRERAAAIRRWA